MRKISTPILAAIIAPATLALAACGGDAEEVAGAGADVATANPAAGFPSVPADARDSVEWAGTYEQQSADGRVRMIALGDDDSYTMTDIDGVETTGTFNWYADNSRILMKQRDTDMVFAIADGAIYELSGPDAGTDGPFDNAQTWREADAE